MAAFAGSLALIGLPMAPASAADAPTVTDVTPDARPVGATVQELTITGTGFVNPAKVSFGTGTGVPVTLVTYVSSTELKAIVDVRGTAVPGPRTVTVTNPDGLLGSCVGCFTVTARPTITSVTPSSLSQGVQGTVMTVRGTGILTGAAVSFGSGVTVVGAPQRISDTELRATVNVGNTATAGTRTVTLTNTDGGTATCASCLTITARSGITVSSVTPSARAQGLTSQTLVIAGPAGSFRSGATVTFGGGVTVASTTVDSDTSMRAVVNIGAGASVGTRNVKVTNTDGSTGTCTACFTVSARPTVASITPVSVAQAANATIIIAGTGFQAGATVNFGGSVNIVDGTFQVVSPTQLRMDVTVGANATVGARIVSVENTDGGKGTCAGTCTFSVTTRPTIPVTSVTPASRGAGAANQNVTVRGSGFTPTAEVSFGSGVTVNSVTYVSTTELTANITVGGGATVGTRAVRVTIPFGAAGECASTCFRVNARPVLTSASPASVARGVTNRLVTITGTGFVAGAGASFGNGVTVQSVTVPSSTQLRATISVASNALLGARTITITNSDGGFGTCTGGCTFTVT